MLLAEDNAVNQKLVVGMLAEDGHEITVVGNGRDAVAAVGREAFDVVLMDVQMPEMSGLEATAAIRKAERGSTRHVPIVAMTAHAMKGDRERFLAAGMDEYVAKPLRIDEVFAAIEAVTRGRPSASRTQAPHESRGTELDLATILAGVGGKRDLLAEVLDVFLVDAPLRLADARAALEKSDAAGVAGQAHTLKSMIGLFTMAEPFAAARELEAVARRGDLPLAAEGLANPGASGRGARGWSPNAARGDRGAAVTAGPSRTGTTDIGPRASKARDFSSTSQWAAERLDRRAASLLD